MRIKIQLNAYNNDLFIPYNHNHVLSALIYQNISDKELRRKLHDSKGYKFFTFSQLYFNDYMYTKDGIFSVDGDVSFIISSPNIELIDSIVEGFTERPEFDFLGSKVIVKDIVYLGNKDVSKYNHFKTVTPLLTRRKKRGSCPYGVNINDPLFFELIEKTAVNKYNKYNGTKLDRDEIGIKLYNDKYKEKMIHLQIKNNDIMYKCYLLDLNITGNNDVIQFLYDSGCGDISSMGFGMIKEVD